MTARLAVRNGAILVSLGLVASCAGGAGLGESASPSPTPSYPVAEIAELVPAQPSPGEFDDDTAVQVMRETSIVLTWANLIDSIDFQQFVQYIDPGSEPGVVGLSEYARRNQEVMIGPTVSQVMAVTTESDGSVVVRTCNRRNELVRKADGQARSVSDLERLGKLLDVSLSPLSDEEISELDALGIEPPPLRVRHYQGVTGECDASEAVAQQFENWRDYAPIGNYDTPDPWSVAIVGEDGLEYVDPDDMP